MVDRGRRLDEVLGSVLLVGHMFHPFDDLAVEFFLNGDVGHGCLWCGSVPVLFVGREPDDVAGANLLNRAAIALSPAEAGGYDQGLAERMGVPCSPRTGLKGDAGALNECGIGCLKERIDAHRTGEPIG